MCWPFKGIVLLCLICIASVGNAKVSKDATSFIMPHTDVLAYAKELISQEKLEDAKKALMLKPFLKKELEIERLYLLAQICTKEGNYQEAIDIYYYILNYEPNIPKIRFLLAELYLNEEAWYRADYYYRSVLASKDLPLELKDRILKALYYIRQNKNWNIWFSMGIAPDTNINNASSGEQCVETVFGVVCSPLDSPDRSVGFNVSAGADYEFKLSDHWRFRNELMAYTSTYDDKKYNDVYLLYSAGPKYVYATGDVFLGLMLSQRFVANESYSRSIGGQLETNYDFTRKLTGNFQAYYTPTFYQTYDILNGFLIGERTRFVYSLDASKYFVLKLGYEHEKTKEKAYTNDKFNYALGFGTELLYGFHMYIEPSVSHVNYADKRWTVKDMKFQQLRERDVTKRLSISLSNRNISIWDTMPILTYSYIRKDSNIWQREYRKSLIELSIIKRF